MPAHLIRIARLINFSNKGEACTESERGERERARKRACEKVSKRATEGDEREREREERAITGKRGEARNADVKGQERKYKFKTIFDNDGAVAVT